MPGKARRVASRQAQLSRRRKRQQSPPNDTLPLVTVPAEVDGNHDGAAAPAPSPVAEPLAPEPSPAPARRRFNPVAARTTPAESTPAPARGPGRGRRERLTTNNYIGPEVRRILVMSGTVLAVIIALGIVL